MLTGTASYSGTSGSNTVNLTGPLVNATFFKIILHVTEGRLIRQGCNGSGTEGLSRAEDNLSIFMRLGLVLTGEIQVDIRLLVSLESQERLKRNIKSVLVKLFSAHRTYLVRHIDSRLTGIGLNLITVKVHIMAFAAIIMGAQGVDLRDSRHGRHKGASYGSTGAYQVSILHRLPYQLLRNDVHYGKSVLDNGVQFLLQSCLYDLRQIWSVNFMGSVITDLRQCLITVGNDRRTFVRAHRCNSLDHVCNHIGIGNNDFFRLITSQIREFFQHLFRGM